MFTPYSVLEYSGVEVWVGAEYSGVVRCGWERQPAIGDAGSYDWELDGDSRRCGERCRGRCRGI